MKEVSTVVIYKRYCIVHNYNDEGTATLEYYYDEESCRKAFEAIRVNGYHISEDGNVKITFEKFDKVVLTMDIELWDEHGNHKGFEPIAFAPIVMKNGIINDSKDIVKILKGNGRFTDAVEEIHSWHSDCEAGNNGECAIYDAIQDGKSDEDIVLIAYEVDMDLVEKYLPSQSAEQTFGDWWAKTGSGIIPLEGDDMETHTKKVALFAWEASKGFTITKLPMLSIDEFVERYKPILNHFREDEETDLFETYGEEIEFVLKQPNTKIWTLVDGDSGLVIEAGYHIVNRVHHFVTENEWTDPNTEVRYCDELED